MWEPSHKPKRVLDSMVLGVHSGCGRVGVAFVNRGKDPWLPAEPPGFKSQLCCQRAVSELQFPYQTVGMRNTNFISLLVRTQ